MSLPKFDNFSLTLFPESEVANTSSSISDQNSDISDIIQKILSKFIRAPVLIFGIIGNILNLIILFRHKSRRTRSAIAFLFAMSMMGLMLLWIHTIQIILEYVKPISFHLITLATNYRCYIRYAPLGIFIWNINFI